MPDSSNNVNARDGASIEWGPEIRVDGKRPEWLANQDRFSWYGCTYRGTSHDWQGVERIRLPADHPHYAKAPTTPQLDPALWDRMVALVREMALRDNGDGTVSLFKIREHVDAAMSIVADLPKPVDPDLIEARRIASYTWQPGAWTDEQWERRVMEGGEDDDRAVRAALAAIKRGRELATPEVLHVG